MQDPVAGSAPSFLPSAMPTPRSVGSLVGLSLRRPGGRRAVSLLTVVLLVSGVSMFSFPAITDLFQRYHQQHAKLGTSQRYLTEWTEHNVKIGEGLTKLVINNDRMRLSVVRV